jgi:hypothetical protein
MGSSLSGDERKVGMEEFMSTAGATALGTACICFFLQGAFLAFLLLRYRIVSRETGNRLCFDQVAAGSSTLRK